jgi:hypothetical protein
MRWLVFILLSALPAHACAPAAVNDTTRWGGNERVEIEERTPVPNLHGVVAWWDGNVIRSVLVEAFPMRSRPVQDSTTGDEKRVGGCVTGPDGSFDLNLPPGRYEVRFSLDKGVNVTVMHITVALRARPRTLRIVMQLGT